jgi:hypothetical protein
MNFDLDTTEGMENAKKWTANMLDCLSPHGTWIVPRSGTMVQFDKANKTANVRSFLPDDAIARVLRAMGYTVTEGTV